MAWRGRRARARPLRTLQRDPRGRRHRRQGHRQIQGQQILLLVDAKPEWMLGKLRSGGGGGHQDMVNGVQRANCNLARLPWDPEVQGTTTNCL